MTMNKDGTARSSFLSVVPFLFSWIISALTWIGGLVTAAVAWILGYFAVISAKKTALSFVYVSIFVSLVFASIASINLIISPLLGPASQIGGALFEGLSYVLPPIIDTALASMIAARITVWIFKVHLKILEIVSSA